jgi:4-hydroxy-tetrahydrodipicolinate synthase
MNTEKYKGTWTALITPFKNGELDYDAIDQLIEQQIEGGVRGILVIGTTGESPTLSDEESLQLIDHTVKKVAGRCLVMAGTGTNNTAKSVKKTKVASALNPDAILVVNPYYNKPTQTGLYLHYKTIAQSTELPVFVYNIKGRTGVNVETETLMKLAADVPNIIGVKEASGDLDQIHEVCEKRPEGFIVLSGDDGITVETMKKSGVDGVVSVASNILPHDVSKMINAGLEGDWETAEQMNNELNNFFETMFVETNPIPVKWVAHKLGWCTAEYRLPMCEPSEETKQTLDQLISTYDFS